MSLINDALKRANQAQRKAPVAGPLGVPLQTAEPPRKSSGTPVIVIGAVLLLAVGGIGALVMLGLRAFEKPPEPVQAPPVQVAVALPQPQVQPKPTPVVTTQPSPAKAPPVASQPAPAVPATTTPPGKAVVAAPVKADNTPSIQPAPLPVTGKETPAPPPAPPVETVKVTEPAVPKVVPAPAPTPPAAQTKVETAVTPPVSVPAATNPPAPVVRKVDFPDLKVTGIFYNPARPAALVSGRKVVVGGTVQGAKVTAIARDSVTVEFEGETKVLYLP